MKPLSNALRSLLDEISVVLARGETPPDSLFAKLESLWRAERPDDVASLTALLSSLRAQPDESRLAAAFARFFELSPQPAGEVGAVQPEAAGEDLFTVTRGEQEESEREG